MAGRVVSIGSNASQVEVRVGGRFRLTRENFPARNVWGAPRHNYVTGPLRHADVDYSGWPEFMEVVGISPSVERLGWHRTRYNREDWGTAEAHDLNGHAVFIEVREQLASGQTVAPNPRLDHTVIGPMFIRAVVNTDPLVLGPLIPVSGRSVVELNTYGGNAEAVVYGNYYIRPGEWITTTDGHTGQAEQCVPVHDRESGAQVATQLTLGAVDPRIPIIEVSIPTYTKRVETGEEMSLGAEVSSKLLLSGDEDYAVHWGAFDLDGEPAGTFSADHELETVWTAPAEPGAVRIAVAVVHQGRISTASVASLVGAAEE